MGCCLSGFFNVSTSNLVKKTAWVWSVVLAGTSVPWNYHRKSAGLLNHRNTHWVGGLEGTVGFSHSSCGKVEVVTESSRKVIIFKWWTETVAYGLIFSFLRISSGTHILYYISRVMYDLLVSNMASLELLEFTQGFCPGKYIDLNSNMTFEPTYCKILNKKACNQWKEKAQSWPIEFNCYRIF